MEETLKIIDYANALEIKRKNKRISIELNKNKHDSFIIIFKRLLEDNEIQKDKEPTACFSDFNRGLLHTELFIDKGNIQFLHLLLTMEMNKREIPTLNLNTNYK